MTTTGATMKARQTCTTTRAAAAGLFKLVLLIAACCSLAGAAAAAPNEDGATATVLRRAAAGAAAAAVQTPSTLSARDRHEAQRQREQQQPQHRQLTFNIGFLSFLADAYQSIKHGCPPIGPAHHKCMSDKTSSTSSSTSYSANGDNGGDSSYTASGSESAQNTSSNNGEIPIGARSLPMWMLIAAAVATALAVIAVAKGLRRSEPPAHALKGSVARRMGLFSQFADCALCDAPRPNRAVEMTMSYDDYEKAAMV